MSEVLKIKSRAVFLFDHTSLDLSEQIDAFRDEDEGADMLLTFLYNQTMERSSFELDEDEKKAVLDGAEKKIRELEAMQEPDDGDCDLKTIIRDSQLGMLKAAAAGCMLLEKEGRLLTQDDYENEIGKRCAWLNISRQQAKEEYSQLDYMLENYSDHYFGIIDAYVGDLMKQTYGESTEPKVYDVAIIGAGPAGLSAALTLKLHNKSIIWFGSPALSDKVEKSEKIANYPGLSKISGRELNRHFREQIADAGLTMTDKMVTNITSLNGQYMLLADNEIYEAKTVLLATGSVSAKGFENELELLGRGVSYCATCDGFLYKGKTLVVYCGSKRYEHEVEYLAGIAKEVYLFTPYKDSGLELPNVKALGARIKAITGEARVEGVQLVDGTGIAADGVFILRSAVAPSTLLNGLEMDGPHIAVDRDNKTNMPGCFAAGDCTGRPYQLTVAMGEGNTAAHAIVEYLSAKK